MTVKLLYNSSVRINPIKPIFYYSKSKEVVLLQVNSRLQIATPLTTAIQSQYNTIKAEDFKDNILAQMSMSPIAYSNSRAIFEYTDAAFLCVT